MGIGISLPIALSTTAATISSTWRASSAYEFDGRPAVRSRRTDLGPAGPGVSLGAGGAGDRADRDCFDRRQRDAGPRIRRLRPSSAGLVPPPVGASPRSPLALPRLRGRAPPGGPLRAG